MPDILRYRGDTDPVGGTLTKSDGSAYDLTNCDLRLTAASNENPAWLFITERAAGTLGAGTDPDTAAAVGAFADAVVGDLFYNVTRGLFAYIETVTSDDEVELDRAITAQTSGDAFRTGDSSQEFQIIATVATPTTGAFEFEWTATEADYLGTLWYDIQLVDAAGKKYTLTKGRIVYRQDITK